MGRATALYSATVFGYIFCKINQSAMQSGTDTMRELPIPAESNADDDAVEMARVWFGNRKCNVALHLGVYENDADSEIDELWAWGNILSDIAQHIANGMKKSHGWDETETMSSLRKHFNAAMKERAPGLEGSYGNEH